MKTIAKPTKSLTETLENLEKFQLSFDEIVDELFAYSYLDYHFLFKLDDLNVENETYERFPVFQGKNCVAILMLWGIDNTTAIHDHGNYDGRIKVLKGELTEVSYRENDNFIEYDGAGVTHENQSFLEEYGGIHSIVNNSDEISVSLHVYRTSQLNLKGVRIFDTENRRIAWLSEYAASCSWMLPKNAYDKVIKI